MFIQPKKQLNMFTIQKLSFWLEHQFVAMNKLPPSLPFVQLANGKWNGFVSIPGAGLASKGLQEG
jgi:hypothetical protein